MDRKYLNIVKHYEECFERHGDSHRGVDWPNEKDANTRYQVMLDIINGFEKQRTDKVTVLDLGCGASHLYDYIVENNLKNIDYSGLDISSKFIEYSRKKHPDVDYYCLDILDPTVQIKRFDYIVMNGVFTEKKSLSFEEMLSYFKEFLLKVFRICTKGVAFNVMSKQVDWERSDLFHLPFDTLSNFLCKHVSRNFIFRNDYGLYEYTTYVYVS